MVQGLCFLDKRYEFGALLASTQGETTRHQVLLATGRKVKINQNKVLFQFAVNAPAEDQAAMRKALAEFSDLAEAEAERIDLDLLWDDVAGKTMSLEQMAALWYGDDATPLHKAAVLKLALAHPVRFTVSADRVTAVDNATLLKRIDAKAAKEEARRLIDQALPAFFALAGGEPGASEKLEGVEAKERFLDSLALRVTGIEPVHEIDRTFLKRFMVGENADERAIAALLAAGREVDFVKVTLARRGVRTEFGNRALAEADDLARAPISLFGRRDLRDLLTFSIDSETTRDYDDAFSVELINEDMIVWVHIADAGDLIAGGGELDISARERIATLYLPDRIHPMLPENLCFGRLSLAAGQDRASLSFKLRFSPSGDLKEFEPVPSLVRVDRNLDFESTAAALADPGDALHRPLVLLEDLRKALGARRREAGASAFPDVEAKITVDDDGKVSIELRNRDAPGSRLVEELMILTNHRAARLCADWGLPSIFRVQEPSPLSGRHPGPSVLTLEPGPHVGLAVEPYVQITSPIRRYPDLIMQRQISHWIEHQRPAYEDRTELLSLAKQAEAELQSIRKVEAEIERYFTLVYFAQNQDASYALRVLKPLRDSPDAYLIEVEETLFRFVETLGEGIEPGTRWAARVSSVRPEVGQVSFSRI